MKTILVWAALLLGLAAQPGDSTSSWPRALFNRNSRNFLGQHSLAGKVAGGFDADETGNVGAYEVIADNLKNNGYTELFEPYAVEKQPQLQEQPEVYGIVEPLIEDTPCANRACLVNDDCCPTGVCVNTYGEGKCIYVYGRKRDECQHNADCAPGSACMPDGSSWRCQATSAAPPSFLQDVFGLKRPLGGDCSSSAECQVAKGMCCQQQRIHHRVRAKFSCAYFRDAFDCIDMLEHLQEVFKHRRN
ncbi:ITG-like peptide isoform X2 [Scaptodrosophila lebanonensis]|uniref:ITG-like peptide isoform X2 n=1 Tax=Drosophila lebanonensis TaxID=7225 RepID=A0A6J2UG96_DROLE|nr:ITG-like peptide isoform X2 [Scaptodrosophila lebanonensis]